MDKKINRRELTNTVKVILTTKVLKQITLCCSKFPHIEWCGAVFYKVINPEASFLEYEYKVLDFVPLGVHTPGATEFDFGIKHLEYQEENNLSDCEYGHIHSHHNMDVFFSSTDYNDLDVSSAHYITLLSIIVNNKGNVCAKIAKRVKTTNNFTGVDYGNKSVGLKTEAEEVLILPCTIEKEQEFVEGTFTTWLDKLTPPKPVIPNPVIPQSAVKGFTPHTGYYSSYKTNLTGKDYWDYYDSKGNKSPEQLEFNFDEPKGFERLFKEEILEEFNENKSLLDAVKGYEFYEPDWETCFNEYCEEFRKETTIASFEEFKGEVFKILDEYKSYFHIKQLNTHFKKYCDELFTE